jgi:putative addiction module component (TIGR02574 family)
MDANALLAAANKLPVDDRIRLVQDIWDGIAEEPATFKLSDAQKRELDRRIAAYEADPDNVLTWEEVNASLQAEL